MKEVTGLGLGLGVGVGVGVRVRARVRVRVGAEPGVELDGGDGAPLRVEADGQLEVLAEGQHERRRAGAVLCVATFLVF